MFPDLNISDSWIGCKEKFNPERLDTKPETPVTDCYEM
jgi:hypothetical protein